MQGRCACMQICRPQSFWGHALLRNFAPTLLTPSSLQSHLRQSKPRHNCVRIQTTCSASVLSIQPSMKPQPQVHSTGKDPHQTGPRQRLGQRRSFAAAAASRNAPVNSSEQDGSPSNTYIAVCSGAAQLFTQWDSVMTQAYGSACSSAYWLSLLLAWPTESCTRWL